MNLNRKRVLVAGAGKTGISTARFLLHKGAQVCLTDSSRSVDIPPDLRQSGMPLVTGPQDSRLFSDQDLIIVSPGIPLTIAPLVEARQKGIPILSEIELAYRFTDTPVIAVTGTNGKTTTTTLLQHIFEACGKKVFTGGNIGTPLIEYADSPQEADYIIAEISSFQLEAIDIFRPKIAILLNITEDHLDRYDCFTDYVAAKNSIFKNMAAGDTAVLNREDPIVTELAEAIKADRYFFSTLHTIKNGAFYENGFHFTGAGDTAFISDRDILLTGDHNRENILAAGSAAHLCGLPTDRIAAAVNTFKGLPHRMEFVDQISGVRFYDDSKATNVGACLKSITSIQPPILLIAGGKDKGGSYLPLKKAVRKNVQELILIGEARERITRELGDCAPITAAATLEEAVARAFSKAAPGSSILLSPACSSFDMFDSYVHRGSIFKKAVKSLRDGML